MIEAINNQESHSHIENDETLGEKYPNKNDSKTQKDFCNPITICHKNYRIFNTYKT